MNEYIIDVCKFHLTVLDEIWQFHKNTKKMQNKDYEHLNTYKQL